MWIKCFLFLLTLSITSCNYVPLEKYEESRAEYYELKGEVKDYLLNKGKYEEKISDLEKKVAELKEDGAVDQSVFDSFKDKFQDALCNDLNTSMAITVLYDVVKADTNDATKLALINDFDYVLSLNLYEEGKAAYLASKK